MSHRRPLHPVLTLAGLLAVATAFAPGCRTTISDRDLVLVGPEEAARIIEHKPLLGDRNAVWVDPRTEREFHDGHIPGAVNLPFQDVERRHQQLDRYDVLVVYGDDYGDSKASAMSKRLLMLGHKEVRTLKGGLRAWLDAGYTLERAEPGTE